jgi:hypothetical protein
MKRVMSTDFCILKTDNNGLKLLTMKDLESNQFTIEDLLETQDGGNYTDSLQIQITPSQIVIAAVHNYCIEDEKKISIKLMTVPIA